MAVKTNRPMLLAWSDAATQGVLEDLARRGEIDEVVDAFDPSLAELFSIEHPRIREDAGAARLELEAYVSRRREELLPSSVVAILPWRRSAVHLPDAETYFRLRTSRNRLLVSDREQERYRASRVAVAGLSVGFSVLQSMVVGGGPRSIRIGDFDRLSIPNLNRLVHSVSEIGIPKTDLAMRRVFELDPFADVFALDGGVTKDALYEFLAPGGRPVDVFFEEMDQLHMKILARRVARELRIPVVMVSDLGDGAKVDVERFDLEPNRPLFHGAFDESIDVDRTLSMGERMRIATKILRPEDMPPRLQESMLAIGRAIHTWPQLGTAVALAGAAGAYAARRIVSGQAMPSGRYSLSLDAALDPDWSAPATIAARADMTRTFERTIGLGA